MSVKIILRAKKALPFFLSVVVLIFQLSNTGVVFGQGRAAQPAAFKERVVSPKPGQTTISDQARTDVIVLKFREGTHIRARYDQWATDLGNLSASEETLLRRANLDHAKIAQELALAKSQVPGIRFLIITLLG